MRTSLIFAASMFMLVPQTAQAQSLLGNLKKVLSIAGQTISNGTVAGKPTATVLITPTDDQVAATHRLIVNQNVTPDLAAEVNSAAPLIELLMQTSACGTSNLALNTLNRYQERPKRWGDLRDNVARAYDTNHDPAQCLDVVRLLDVQKSAPNELSFTAYYISPSSQIGTDQSFSIVKTSSNEWQIRRIGWTILKG